jgi:hypothetical protein
VLSQKSAALILVMLAGGSNVLRDTVMCLFYWRWPWALPKYG